MSIDNTEVIPDDPTVTVAPDGREDEQEAPESERRLVKVIQERVRADKKQHEKAFKQMRQDMYLARHGRRQEDQSEHYKANLAGRHVKQKTAALYAKNPKAVARRRETLDFAVWDEKPDSLMMAFQTIQMGQQLMLAAQSAMPGVGGPPGGPPDGPVTGAVPGTPDTPGIPGMEGALGAPGVPGAPGVMGQQMPAVPPEMITAFSKAMEVVADYQQGTDRRKQIDRIGKTLEVLFAQAMREQKPVDFKTGMKQCVRRACTTGVGYIELGFQRQLGPRPGLSEQLADARQRLDHLSRLADEVSEGEIEEDDPEMAELQASVAALENEPELVLREGLIIDFPASTKVIPDKLTKHLQGFVGARWVTVEYNFTSEQVEELFGVDLHGKYTGYTASGLLPNVSQMNTVRPEGANDLDTRPAPGGALVCVWKHYDKTSGLCYFVADGHDAFLRPPAAPDVFVEDFWPVYALTFNAVESEEELFPPSDVYLLTDQQIAYNQARQGLKEHRYAARPRWLFQNGAVEDADINALIQQKPFTAQGINFPQPNAKIPDIFQAFPVPGVDPNLYETGQIFTDIQFTVGTNESQFGGLAKATATESAIAAGAVKSTDAASIDDLDAFLSTVTRAAGQILLKEMSEEQVQKVAGVGALWPQMSLEDIASEIYLEVEAGSSGKPNQAVETQNFKELVPLLLQIPGIKPEALAREGIKRLDDRLNVTDFIEDGIAAIVAQNRMQQVAPQNVQNDPNAQGGQGANNAPAAPPHQQQGSEPHFGSNQT